MASNHNHLLDFEDPGMMPKELMDMPGFVNELKDYTLLTGQRNNEPIAFAGALAMLAHLTGNTYRGAAGTNLYIAALAPSGMGKEDARGTNKRLAAELNIVRSVQSSVASGQGLEDAVTASPSLLLQADEADTFLTATRSGESRASVLNAMILEFFSDAATCHETRLSAKNGGRGVIIRRPHLTLFATGVPKYFYEALSARSLDDGLLGRCLFIDADGFRPFSERAEAELPSGVLDAARMMTERERHFRSTGVLNPITVEEPPETKVALAELARRCDTETERLMNAELTSAATLYARLREKAVKLAVLRAISADPYTPVLMPEAVIWGTKFALHVTQRMLYMTQFYVAEGRFDRLKKRFLALLAKHGGQLDHSTLLRGLRIDATLFRKLVTTLQMCELIEDEELIDGKHGYILKGAN